MISKGCCIRKTVTAILLALLAFGAGFTAIMARAEEGKDSRIFFPLPDTHKGNWIEFHGKTVVAGGSGASSPDKECLMCHRKTDCMTCHNTTMPRDHNNFWRTRSHGITARGNRERCIVCHRQDYCIRCHSDTAPRTHTANWRTRHCAWCHFGPRLASTDNCRVCHTQALHISAPHPVNAGLNCAQCHR